MWNPKLSNVFKIVKPLESDNIVNCKGVRKQNWPYSFIWVIYYAWVIVFSTWWTASPLTENVFDTDMRNLLHSANLISSAIFIFIIKKEWFVKTARIGAVLIIAGVSVFMATQSAYFQLFSVIVIGISLGCVNTSILMPFVFTLNNTEKLYAVVGSNMFINLLLLFLKDNSGNHIQSNKNLLLSFVVLLIALSATLFFKRNCIPPDEQMHNKPKIRLKVYWTLFFSCAFAVLCKGAGNGILNITVVNFNAQVLTWYYLGGFTGCLIYFFLDTFFAPKSIHLAWNITFGSVTMGLLCNAYAIQVPTLAVVFAFLLGRHWEHDRHD